MREFSVVVVGGGASGTLLAAALAREDRSLRIAVVEPRDRLGRGLAYSTECDEHLLNVPAARMSAFAGDDGHFVRWLHRRYERYDARSFVPRSIYGDYLGDVAAEARAAGRVEHIAARAMDAAFDGEVRVTLTSGDELRSRALVLAIGNAAPARWSGAPDFDQRYYPSAWEPGALVPSDPNEAVMLLGTGLTAIDAVLGLRKNGHRGPITMISRRGLLPHEHRVFDAPPGDDPEDWRVAVDRLRPDTNARWQAMPLAERRRFLRHLMPYWSVHRHRMAPEVAAKIADATASGALRMVAGRTGSIEADAKGLHVAVTMRGTPDPVTLDFSRIVNCSGPENDVRKLRDRLVARLLASGILTPHPLGIGINVADDGALVDERGERRAPIYAIGPVRFGTLIETTAIPEIRVQAAGLARVLASGCAVLPGLPKQVPAGGGAS